MAAVFSAFIAVDVKFLAALGTSEVVDRLSFDLTEMLVPPRITAFVTAEPLSFPLGDLPNLLSAVFAVCDFLHDLGR